MILIKFKRDYTLKSTWSANFAQFVNITKPVNTTEEAEDHVTVNENKQ